ncbi:AAA family ATPase [Chryseobacterium takakiae]|uniref:AAA domain (Dynein-related subfamily) n=1 Tax=Chryseobacterium takakiae TaxID=1302685 RepID=A0A1M5A6A8_9FLAO|nr:AAA family ATPase [Chryseobacterium takakiae]SHF25556.1 AAA domain (dynein-related subfamily) [Chryseobacterium takakiae]
MDINLQNKISEYLKAERNQAIINSDEFYFQKAKDELQKFLDLEVREEEKQILIANKKKYEELKKLFQDSEEFSDFGKTIFSLVSYCDLKAYKKNELNQYDDKRVLASAFVRMNNWLEQLITYKFEGQLSEGSVKNAIEYLLHPEDHFTMLSENHRSLISENLFKKSYNKSTFKQDFIDFFSGLSIQVKNPVNYTHLLSCLSYDISPEWKESIIGLISPDGTGWQEGAINDLNGADYIILWNHRKPNGTTKTFKLLKDCIDENGSFKIFYTSKNNAIYIAEVIDFATSAQEYNKVDWENNYENITWKLNSFDEYRDGDKSASWVYLVNKFYKIEPIPSSHFKYYFSSGYPSVGSQTPIISMISNIEFKKNQNMKKTIELLQYKKQIILQGPPGTGKTREAKQIAQNILGLNEKELQESKQFKIIQFHPSYTYEDFVRGIVARPNPEGEGIIYEAENKTLGKFAKNALENYKKSQSITSNNSLETDFDRFINFIIEQLDLSGKFNISENVYIFSVEDNRFKYKGDNWSAHANGLNMNFSQLKKIIELNLNSRQEIVKNELLNSLTRQHATYYQNFLDLYKKFISNNPSKIDKEDLKNFVLVIDEINRANLSSVLGELIYALEYRGEKVESMYEVDGSQNLVLPPNLYIIGTMNTADRSVGHIDYAIRRRFAFVDVMPKDLTSEMEGGEFYTDLFSAVKALFTKDEYKTKSDFISQEFEPKDVALGHSYFINKSEEGADMKVRWNYEIKPILLEYVRDGVLKTDALKKINELETTFSLKIE